MFYESYGEATDSLKRIYIGIEQTKYECCICNKKFYQNGNDSYPISNIEIEEKCCDKCNQDYVIKSRLALSNNEISLEQFGLSWKAKDFLKVYKFEKRV